MIWPIFWIIVMVALVSATIVVAMLEKKARAKAIKDMAPPPMDEGMLEGDPMAGDPMAEGDFGDGFGDPSAGDGELAELDENAFK